ncbi:glycosyltransferase family 8 protein [Hymenobacter sp. NST-14]|uniref:glycosyltransferase family 8 protein n=1 Tax=Hymenobacter piscis TaxID=2839984 RepID=UPI001C01BBFD|nr:glycosyltransferase family 8 protein [Hymenobacter piscis]MBT9393953.1 glycosyltransferase family 8 protein [Hymenobacter piscis]
MEDTSLLHTELESMHIAIAFDENYITPVYVLLASIFENNANESILIHAIVTGVTDKQKIELKEYTFKFGSSIYFYGLEEGFANDFALPKSLWWTPSVYYRIMFPTLLPIQVDKFLYLDTDIVIIGKLRTLYEEDVKNVTIAAACDFVDARPELGIMKPNSYFNSGVMLVNRRSWVEKNIAEKCIDFIKNNPEKLLYVDQDALNAVLINDWNRLDYRFNFMFQEKHALIPMREARKQLENVVVLHFTTQHKPWSVLNRNRFRFLYFKYLKKIPRKYRNRYNDFSWNRHRIRETIEIRLSEWSVDYSTLVSGWRRK